MTWPTCHRPGQRRGPNRYFEHIRGEDQWKQAIQGYLASIAFADAMVGRVLDALEKGPNRDNTIVVLWSDHGWHLGEKQHWQKYTAWRVCTRVPLIVRVPKGTTGLPAGTRAGSVCQGSRLTCSACSRRSPNWPGWKRNRITTGRAWCRC